MSMWETPKKTIAYLRRNTHLQVECSLIAPPSTGPRTLARAKTEDIIAMYLPILSKGTISGAMTMTMEYIPDPPTPWKARATILTLRQKLLVVRSQQHTHSHSMDWAVPQTTEKTVNTEIPSSIITLRPKISLNLA